MYPFIVCYTCGFRSGDLYDAFIAMRREKYKKAYDSAGLKYDPALTPINESIQVDLSDVFEQLGIRMDCCKTHMCTQVMFNSFY